MSGHCLCQHGWEDVDCSKMSVQLIAANAAACNNICGSIGAGSHGTCVNGSCICQACIFVNFI